MKTVLALLMILSLCAAACGGSRDPDVPDEKYIEYGSDFENVVLMRVINSEGTVEMDGHLFKSREYAEASGVAIEPHWIITAGHVVYGSKGTFVVIDKKELPITKTIIHKDYSHNDNGVYDVALCYSPTDLGMEEYVQIYTEKDELGKEVAISGFGRPGDFNVGCGKFDGKRRAGSNKIDCISSELLFCSPSVEDSTPLEFMITPGDSGGGLFIDGKLAGINSFLRSHNQADHGKSLGGRWGQESAFMRMSKLSGWVREQIGQSREAKNKVPGDPN